MSSRLGQVLGGRNEGLAGSLQLWLRFARFFRPYRGRLAATFVATLARPLLNAAKIYLLKLIVDNLAQHPSGQIVAVIIGGYLAISLGKGIANFGDEYLGVWVGGRVIVDLRQEVFSRFLRLSLRYHASHRVGESISRLVSDVGAVESMLISGLTDGLAQVLTVLIYAAMLFYLDPLLAALSLTVLPLLFLSLAVYARRSRRAFQDVRVRLAELTASAEETLSTIALAKAFMRQQHAYDQLHTRAQQHLAARLDAARQRAVFVPLSDLLATVGTVLVIYFGAQALQSGTLSIGGLVVFLAYLGQMYNPLVSLSRLGNMLQGGLAAAERVAALLELPAAEDEPSLPTRPWSPLAPTHRLTVPAIEFEHVAFAYSSGSTPALRDFSLVVPQGALVALVGASGAGKSTAVALLQRLYEPDAGAIRVFGHDAREATTAALRQLLAVVPQEPGLLAGTIWDNIRYGDLEASAHAITLAAEQAGILDMPLADGVHTEVGPRGSRLSGGQRQRVAIARALVRGAPILLLDEATSALDTISEERLRRLLGRLRPQHTVVVVAHRLSTVRNADLIAVVEDGRVVEQGTHDELMARDAAYAALIRAQLDAERGVLQDSLSDANGAGPHRNSLRGRVTAS